MKAARKKMSEPEVHPITAAGGVVFRYGKEEEEPQILMIFRNNHWDLPKGKLEPGESIAMCAAREVAEEVGSHMPAIVSYLDKTYHEYEEKGVLMGKTTYWYAMIFTKAEQFVPQKEEGIEKVEWVSVHKAIEQAGYKNLKDILQVFQDSKKSGS